MEIKQGYAYHIKDEYFTTAKDEHLMKNKEDNPPPDSRYDRLLFLRFVSNILIDKEQCCDINTTIRR